MEQFIQVLIDASSSFSWWHWLLGLGVAFLSGGFGMGIVFALKEYDEIYPAPFFIILVLALILITKYTKLYIRHNRLSKYLYNYLNIITSARYGNLNSRCEDGVDALTIQLSRNTNAFLESVIDRDTMISEYIEKEKQSQNIKQDFFSCLAHDLKVPIIAQDNTYDLFLNEDFGSLTNKQKEAVENYKKAMSIFEKENLTDKVEDMKRQLKHLNSSLSLK